jgi:hypothetical protein
LYVSLDGVEAIFECIEALVDIIGGELPFQGSNEDFQSFDFFL